ncbi:MAG: hypothetical protein CSB24_04835 [Deltaproteobacteria bacterium]|nr:MAG: hypothetical protein CSB24_04835 [Deltaproteobacteria bacterium]
MSDKAEDRKLREKVRIKKGGELSVKRLAYPMAAGPGEKAALENLSEDGICFCLAGDYKKGDHLCISVDISGWQHHRKGVSMLVDDQRVAAPLTAIVEVAWVSESEGRMKIGAKFLDIFEDDYKALKSYLKQVRYSAQDK